MCYSISAVANYFIEKSLTEQRGITHMHMQKMLFFAHAAYCKQTGKLLFVDPIFAWQHGPVVESLYHELKEYGNGNIRKLIQFAMPDANAEKDTVFPFRIVTPFIDKNDGELTAYLDSVWDSLSIVETWKLRELSHQEGGAWYETVATIDMGNGKKVDPSNDEQVRKFLPRNLTILDDVIRECGR